MQEALCPLLTQSGHRHRPKIQIHSLSADLERMQAWAGQAAALARAEPAAELVRRLWQEAEALLPSVH